MLMQKPIKIAVEKIGSENQQADILTKRLINTKFLET
jgi:hypothetical protein